MTNAHDCSRKMLTITREKYLLNNFNVYTKLQKCGYLNIIMPNDKIIAS